MVWIWHDTVPPKSTIFGLPHPIRDKTHRTNWKSYSHCFGILLFIGGATKGEILLQRSKTAVLHERLACLKHIVINSNMGPRLCCEGRFPGWLLLSTVLLYVYWGSLSMCNLTFLSKCYSFFWPDLVKKGRLMNDQSLRHTQILLLSGRTRPLRSHYWLCSSLYPKGNPMHWDSRLDHHQTHEWVLNQCLLLSFFLLIKSQSQVEVETRDQPVDMLRWTSLPLARSESQIHCAKARSWRSPKIEDCEKQGKWELKVWSLFPYRAQAWTFTYCL